MNYGEYTTVNAVRVTYLGSAQSTDDALILSIIRQVSREIDGMINRTLYPRIETRQYDTPWNRTLVFDDDLLALVTLTNGNGNTVAPTDVVLYPLNVTPKETCVYLPSAGQWQLGTSGQPFAAVNVAGVWGFHTDYSNAWQDTAAALTADVTSGSAAAMSVTPTLLFSGDLLKIDSEYLYASSITSGSAVMARGVNGSTAATHTSGTEIYRWTVNAAIEMLARQAVAAYYRLRSNPGMETTTIDGVTFTTPRDISAYMRKQLITIAGIFREGLS